MTQNHRQRIGRWGENVAAYYLEKKGYRVQARNVRTPRGEIDLIAFQESSQSSPVVVFVEVKTRTNTGFGLPEEAVDPRKLDHIFLSADAYLQDHPEQAALEWRIDVIAIQGQPGSKVEDVIIEHFENVSA